MRKIQAFTIVELIVAMSLTSIIISFLFVNLRNFVVIQTNIKKELPKIVEIEKSYVFLSHLLDKAIIDKDHPIKLDDEYGLTFYYLPSKSDCDTSSSLFFANLKFEPSYLKLKIFSVSNKKKELIKEFTVLEGISNFEISQKEDPQAILIDFDTKNKKTKWTFLLDPNFQSDKTI